MILIGRYFSPFVRRVGVTLHHYGIDFEHRSLKAGGEDQEIIRKSNPLGRVPTLVLDNGQVMAESAVILEYLDSIADPDRVLVPPAPDHRFRFLSELGIATGAAEKVIAVYMEEKRPEDKRYPVAIETATRQAKDGFEYLDRRARLPWMWGDRMTQLDVSLVSYWEFMKASAPSVFERLYCPTLESIVAQAVELPEFIATDPYA